MRIVIGGTRHAVTQQHGTLIAHMLAAAVSQSAIGVKPALVTGCCPSGVDQIVRQWATNNGWPYVIVPAQLAASTNFKSGNLYIVTAHGRSAKSLSMRTVVMASVATQVISCPQSAVVPHSGSWLLAHTAALMHKPLAVLLPPAYPFALPTCHNINGWQSVPAGFFFNGAGGFGLHVPVIHQTSLF